MKKKVFLLAVMAAVCACSNESETSNLNSETTNLKSDSTMVRLSFSPYEQTAMARTTRAATSIANYCTRLDVWISEGDNVIDLHQTSTDNGFGTASVSLNRLKTYTLVAVAHRAGGAATLTDGIIAFPDDKVTHAMVYTGTFCPGTTTSITCEMRRIVGMLRFEISDAVPDDAYTFKFEMGNRYNRWDVTNAVGVNATERVSAFNNFNRDEQTHTAAFSLYVIPTNLTDTDHMDVTVRALKQNGDEIETKTMVNVPIKAGYKTTYRGQFFTTKGMSMTFTADDWSEFDVIEY